MGKRLIFVLTLVLAVAMVGAALTYAGGHGFRNGGLRAGRGDRPFANLTEEQRAEIRALVETKKEAGATREQIREAVGAKLQEWGIELPERQGPFADLTEEQRAELQQLVEGMKDDDASRTEICAAVRDQLAEWGIELPERQGPLADLTDEQRAEIRALVETKKEAGATREQIREAVGAKLQEWGIELPQKRGLRHGCVLRHGFFRGPYPAEESAAEPEETAPEEISAKLSTTTAVQSASWGEIKSQFK